MASRTTLVSFSWWSDVSRQQYCVIDVVYVVTTYLVKASLLSLFLQLFWIKSRTVRVIRYGFCLLTLLAVPHFVISVIRTVRCSGLAAVNLTICKNDTINQTNLTFGVVNVVTDFLILLIPVHETRVSQMQRKQKLCVLAVFLAGLIACIMSICRIAIVSSEYGKNDQIYTAARVSQFR
jgi:hypothetical protein